MVVNRTDLMHIMRMKNVTSENFNFDMLSCPPISSMFTQDDISQLKYLATTNRYSGNPVKKMEKMDKIMRSRGFTKLSAGTNRMCYRCLEDNSFVVKIAYNKAGMHDSPDEFKNQAYLKPYCTKIFEVAGDGVISTAERVSHIKNREVFMTCIEDIFALLNDWVKGRGFLMNDASSRTFMNFGIREGFGPVLLDYSYLYKIDPSIKLKCKIPINGHQCGGHIGYDDAFSCMICYKCKKIYPFKEVADKLNKGTNDFEIIKGDKNKMGLKLVVSGGSHATTNTTTTEEKVVATTNTPIVNKNASAVTKPTSGLVLKKERITIDEPAQTTATNNGSRLIDNHMFQQQKKNDGIIRSNAGVTPGLVLKTNRAPKVVEEVKPEDIVFKEADVVPTAVEVPEEVEEDVKAIAADALAIEQDDTGFDKEDELIPTIAATVAREAAEDALVFTEPQPTLVDICKSGINDIVKVLGLYDTSDSLDLEEKKDIIAKLSELVVKIINKTGNSLNAKQKDAIIDSIFSINGMKIHSYIEANEVHSYIGDDEDGYYEEDNVLSLLDSVDDTESVSEEITYDDNTAEETEAEAVDVDEEEESTEDVSYSSVVYFNARMVDISSIVTSERPSNVIVITDDNNVPMATGEGVIAINMLDGRDVNSLSIVSSEYLNGITSENDTLRGALEMYTASDEDSSGVVGDKES